jgi:hypothetical protein
MRHSLAYSGSGFHRVNGATMTKYLQIFSSVVLVAMVVRPVLAQERQQVSSLYVAPEMFYYLTQKSVQEELKLSDDQVKKVMELHETQRDDSSKFRSLSLSSSRFAPSG